LTPLLSNRLVLSVAAAGVFTARAGDLEPMLTEMEGPVRTWQTATAQGLPSDSITAIIQTADGFLWVGTSEGLVRFDGVKFTAAPLPQPTRAAGISVTSLCEGRDGHLWVGTLKDGLFELAGGLVSQFTKSRGLLDDNVTSVAADNNGQVWVGTKSGLNVSTGQGFKAYTPRDGLPDEFVSGVHVARSGTVWITTRSGMCQFVDGRLKPYPLEIQGRSPEYLGAYVDRRGNVWAYGDTYLINVTENRRFNYFRGNEASSVRLWSLCERKDGRLWLGTSGPGLYCFDNNSFQPVILGDPRWTHDVRAVFEDREGNLWLGTSGGGLVQLRTHPVRVLGANQGLPARSATSLALDPAGRVLVGLQHGGLFAADNGRFERFGNGSGLEMPDFISSVCVGRDGVVWAGTLGGGLYACRNGRVVQYTTASGLSDNSVLSVCADTNGAVWAATRAGVMHRCTLTNIMRFDTANGLPATPVTAVIPSSSGGLWLGTEDGTILYGEGGRFNLALAPRKSSHRPVVTLGEGSGGRLWIGTAGAGLACLSNGRSHSWSIGSGIPSDVVAGIVEDTAGNLWLATAAGIYQVNRNTVEKALAGEQETFPCEMISEAKTSFESLVPFGATRALGAPDGSLWFATSEGVLSVDPKQSQTESSALPVYVESVSFGSRPPISILHAGPWSAAAPTNAVLDVRGDLASLDVQFTALNFSAPDKVRFRHKLEGTDTDWEEGTARSAHYSHLPFGHYRFRVAARYADGAWQETPASFTFDKPAPLYLRSGAIVLYGIGAVGLVTSWAIALVRVVSHRRLRRALARLEQQQALERERMRIARDMHDEMGSKLTKISFLSEHAKVEAGATGALSGKIESIAETSRELLQAMDEIVWVVNPQNDNLEQLAAYLGHYAVEYFQTTSIECDLRLPPAIPQHALSSEARHNLFLAFEEALNNALKHSGATAVKIEMVANLPEFEIQITDNGRGFTVPPASDSNGAPGPSAGTRAGYGLKNMRQRLHDIGGECLIRSPATAQGGTTVSMRIHLNGNS
jgi:ligand-binding sensor domain-containing protein/signal transduction histidine kinase